MSSKRKPTTAKAHFEVSQRPYDGKWNRWIQVQASQLGLLGDPEVPVSWDYKVWVIQGVYPSKTTAIKGVKAYI